jgi:hypothetical protein
MIKAVMIMMHEQKSPGSNNTIYWNDDVRWYSEP